MARTLAAESSSLTSRRKWVRQLLTTMVNTTYAVSVASVIRVKPIS